MSDLVHAPNMQSGTEIQLPLSPELQRYFANDNAASGKHVIAQFDWQVAETAAKGSFGARTYRQLMLCGFVATHQDEYVTTTQILQEGYPFSSTSVKNRYTLAARDLGRLSEAGMPITEVGGRKFRKYGIPELASFSLKLVSDLPDINIAFMTGGQPIDAPKRACSDLPKRVIYSDRPMHLRVLAARCAICPVYESCNIRPD